MKGLITLSVNCIIIYELPKGREKLLRQDTFSFAVVYLSIFSTYLCMYVCLSVCLSLCVCASLFLSLSLSLSLAPIN